MSTTLSEPTAEFRCIECKARVLLPMSTVVRIRMAEDNKVYCYFGHPNKIVFKDEDWNHGAEDSADK